ncbi:MAG: hypothetical protein VX028_01445 [Nanoarchaeota archaeon]|nr:hypothetical protein [Nanoarchaeota archaeon]MEC8339906.1 hypothetical protein [Nanoarchaeota archaeon]
MNARYAMCLAITLTNEDKLVLETRNSLECTVFDFPHQKVFLHVFDDIELIVSRDSLEVEGFHAEAFPQHTEIPNRLRYDIYMDRLVIDKLLSEPENIVTGNHFASRSFYDWFDFNYFGF